MHGTTIKISRLDLSLHNNNNNDSDNNNNDNNDDTYLLIRVALLIISLGLHVASTMIVSLFKAIWEVHFLKLSMSVLHEWSYMTHPQRTLFCLTPEDEGTAIF